MSKKYSPGFLLECIEREELRDNKSHLVLEYKTQDFPNGYFFNENFFQGKFTKIYQHQYTFNLDEKYLNFPYALKPDDYYIAEIRKFIDKIESKRTLHLCRNFARYALITGNFIGFEENEFMDIFVNGKFSLMDYDIVLNSPKKFIKIVQVNDKRLIFPAWAKNYG